MKKKEKDNFHLASNISRRDFIGGTLVGFGASLVNSITPLHASSQTPVGVIYDSWTGYGGVGDYAISNGNVASVRDAAHLVRDGAIKTATIEDAVDINEEYDMVIVGGGFSGIGAAYQFHKQYGSDKKCLLLENHPVFGGEAKQNEFEVDGYMLYLLWKTFTACFGMRRDTIRVISWGRMLILPGFLIQEEIILPACLGPMNSSWK